MNIPLALKYQNILFVNLTIATKIYKIYLILMKLLTLLETLHLIIQI